MSDTTHTPAAPAVQGSHQHIIVFVDDEEAILAALQSLFRKSGHSIHTFTSAADALEFIARAHVDLVVSDLRMPVMTGVEFLNHVAGVNPQAVRLILSGYEDKSIVMNALAKGLAQHFILKPWDDTALRALVQQSLARLGELRRQRLATVLGSIDSLPSPPRFQARLHGLLARPNVSLDLLAREIETNPPIVAKLLRVANSVYYASRKSVTSVRDAVTFIGTEYVAGLVAAMEVFHGFSGNSSSGVDEQIEILWSQALKRSSIARSIAEQWPGLGSPHQVHVASLLQDVGFAVRLCSDTEKYAQFTRMYNDGSMTRYEADASVFGITHDDVGAALLEYWNLPSEIVKAVAHHHRLSEGNAAVQILQIAEILDDTDSCAPHDPAVNALVPIWRTRIKHEPAAAPSTAPA
jgi:HD-like signal output (HDOD) protein/CheY-like chemotaxis protein